jgi:hypothetical protein
VAAPVRKTLLESSWGVAQLEGSMKDLDLNRVIGKKEILPLIEKLYDIHTWPGAIKFIRRNGLPLRRTPSGRPMFFKHELIKYDTKFQDIISLP